MFLRRKAAAPVSAVVALVLCGLTAPAALAAGSPSSGAPSAKLPDGLYGKADPKFDGVWRQSLTLLAQDAAGAFPAGKAVDWLTGQQCADGSFTAYRAVPGSKCDPKKTPSDTNATSVAVQALAAVGGHTNAVKKATGWLTSVQNKDGGWGFGPGGPSDANSTSIVIGALSAAGEKVEGTGGKDSPYDALAALQLGCEAPAASRGAYAYQPGKDGKLAANDDATAAAALAGLGEGMTVEPLGEDEEDRPLKPLDCAGGSQAARGKPLAHDEAADAGAAYLASVMKKNGGHLDSVMPGAKGQPDYANTADAVIALAAGGHSAAAQRSLDWLAGNLGKWDKAKSDPAAIATVMMAVHATGGDPAVLGGTDLLKRLDATGPAPAKLPESPKSGSGDGGSGTVVAWSLASAAVVVVAALVLVVRRKRQGQ